MPISKALPTSSAAPTPNTWFRIDHSRLKLSSSPIENRSRMMPNSANGAIPSGSLIVTVDSHGMSRAMAPRANGPATIPTRMKPITGLIFNRANAGMTIPAAPEDGQRVAERRGHMHCFGHAHLKAWRRASVTGAVHRRAAMIRCFQCRKTSVSLAQCPVGHLADSCRSDAAAPATLQNGRSPGDFSELMTVKAVPRR